MNQFEERSLKFKRGVNIMSGSAMISAIKTPSEFEYNFIENILYWHPIDTDKNIRLANFFIEIERIYNLVSLNGGIDKRILIKLTSGERTQELMIALTDFRNLMKIIESNYLGYYLYPDSRRQYDLFKLYAMEVYENKIGSLTIETVYQNEGWNLTPNNKWHYYSGNDVGYCESDFRLANNVCFQATDLINWAMGLLEIGPDEVMIPLILHAHLGYTLKLFETAGYQEQYILALIGESGSKKTSLARVLFELFNGGFINFTSTDRAIELEMMNRQDSTLVLDDLSCGNDKFLAGKFEKILRQLGDSTGRKKSINGGTELDSVSTRCAIILTAETDIDALSKSSKLRTLAIKIGVDSLNSAKLAIYQQDMRQAKSYGQPSKLEQYMTFYIDYLEKNYSAIVKFLTSAKYNSYGEELYFARQVTIFKMLMSQAFILLDFWGKYLLLPQGTLEFMYARIHNAVTKVMIENEQRGKAFEPYILFLKAIAEMIARSGLVIPDKNAFGIESALGYWQNGNVIVKAEQTYNYVCQYYARQGRYFPESLQAILDKLYAMNLLEVYEQTDHKAKLCKQVKINGVTQKVICLKWSAVEMLLSNYI